MPYTQEDINKKIRRAKVLLAGDQSDLTSSACSGEIIHITSIRLGNVDSGEVHQAKWGHRNSGSSDNVWADEVGLAANSNEVVGDQDHRNDVYRLEAGQKLIGYAEESGLVSASVVWWHE